MLRISLAAVSLSVLLAACGGSETETETAATPPATTAGTVAPTGRPMASASMVETTWTGSELRASDLIGVTPDGDSAVLNRIADGEDVSGRNTTGARLHLGLPAEADLSGLTLVVSVTASSATDSPAPFLVAYTTNRKGNSGWNEFEASSTPETFSFTYTIEEGDDDNGDWVGISVADGVALKVDEVSLSVE
ncbi:MAG: hypothetical protein CMK07_13765 [Ponticaulis sp.]|nr:hypothetical protein [Ponticaulis sp.]